jgi:hypothetical protein
MNISDLSFMNGFEERGDSDSERLCRSIFGASGASIAVGSAVYSLGDYTTAVTGTNVFAFSSPQVGDVAVGYGLGYGFAYTAPTGQNSWLDWTKFYI